MSDLTSLEKLSNETYEISLRPISIDEYIGQEELIRHLKIFIKAALARDETLDHVLLSGPPGLGKTTLAHIIANEMHSKVRLVNGPSIEKVGDLAAILSCIEPGEILFIDEIHRIPSNIEEILYGAMEDYKLNIVVSNEAGAKSIVIDLPPFTLVGATTRLGDLSHSLRTRFGIVEKLNYYNKNELTKIINRTAQFYGNEIDNRAALEIATRSRGTPRIANRLFRRVRDFSQYYNEKIISLDKTIECLNSLQIDPIGLDSVDIRYLKTILIRFNGGPVGLETIADTIGELKTNIEDVYEPYLLQLDFINRTIHGRQLTKKAEMHIKKFHQN